MDVGVLAMPRRPAPRVSRDPSPPIISNARLAMVVVIAAESMLFAGLVGTFLVFRLAASDWPPGDLPRLPLLLTGLNTIVLFASLAPMTVAMRAMRRGRTHEVRRHLRTTALLGVAFLAVQGFEWMRLVGHGLTLASGTYGATFYVLIGCHGVHVLVAVLWLVAVAALAARGRVTAARYDALEMCALYWYFVCALWAVLFPLVYVA